jgi:hypothetical protein
MALPPLPPEGTPFLDTETGRMNQLWRAFFRAFAPLLESVADDIAAIEGDVAAIGDTVIADSWCDFIAEVENDDITVVQKAEFAGTITGCVTDADSGTCTVRPKIDGVNVGSSNNSVSTTESDVTHSTSNTFTVGQTISYTISANSACLGARIQINYTRQLVD